MDYKKKIEEVNKGNHFMIYNHMKIIEIREDHAVAEMEVKEDSKNLFGGIHGGALVTLADCAAGAAARSRGATYVTLDQSFNFHRTTNRTCIRAYSEVRHRGKTICVVYVELKDDQDKLLAHGTFTMFAVSEIRT